MISSIFLRVGGIGEGLRLYKFSATLLRRLPPALARPNKREREHLEIDDDDDDDDDEDEEDDKDDGDDYDDDVC